MLIADCCSFLDRTGEISYNRCMNNGVIPKRNKVCAIFSSPRKKSNSTALGQALCDGLAQAGAEVRQFSFREMSIAPCMACDYCRRIDLAKALAGEARFCAVHDDMDLLTPAVAESDILVLASPVYSFSLSAQLKIAIDRIYALWRSGETDSLEGKRLLFALTYGDEDIFASGGVNAIRSLQDLAAFYRMEPPKVIHARADKQGEIAGNGPLLEEVREAGRNFLT